MIRTKEYTDEVFERFWSGGTLWFYERTDTNEFPKLNFRIQTSHSPSIPDSWSKPIDIWNLHKAYLTKEDAESEYGEFTERGCRCCGNGSVEIPVEIREHEFIKK